MSIKSNFFFGFSTFMKYFVCSLLILRIISRCCEHIIIYLHSLKNKLPKKRKMKINRKVRLYHKKLKTNKLIKATLTRLNQISVQIDVLQIFGRLILSTRKLFELLRASIVTTSQKCKLLSSLEWNYSLLLHFQHSLCYISFR